MGEAMRALRIHEPGGPDRLVMDEAAVPVPGIGDALVRVHAASFTPTELSWPSTWVDRLGHDRRPVIPGHEFSGVVEALGYGSTGVAAGDAVYGLPDWYRDGAAADYIAAEVRNLAPKPASLDHVAAASVPLAGLTAWQALFVHGGLQAGESVLIHGAAGGVGVFAVQLARAAGALVVATGRAWARELVTELGADRFVDLAQQRFEDVVSAVDLVFDLIGGEVLERSASVLKPEGVLVTVVQVPQPTPGVRKVFFVVEPDGAQLRELGRRIDAGQLRPIVGRVSPLSDGAAAFAAKQGRGLPGKAVLRVA